MMSISPVKASIGSHGVVEDGEGTGEEDFVAILCGDLVEVERGSSACGGA